MSLYLINEVIIQMSVGSKIRTIRILRNMTQKELGRLVGFSASTADVRIRQYESNKMVPKEEKLKDIANALNVDVSALKDHDIYSDLDLMQVLFELEEHWGLEIQKENGKYLLSFDEDHELTRYTTHNLDNWYQANTKVPTDPIDADYKEAKDAYKLWKHSFPLDKNKLEECNEAKVAAKYAPLVTETLENGYNITTVKDFILVFEKLIRNGIEIEIVHAPELSSTGCNVVGAILKHSQLLEATGAAAEAYVEYLAMIQCIEKMDIEIMRSTSTYEDETLNYTYFFDSPLSTALNHVVRKLMTAYRDGLIDDRFVQMEYEGSLKTFNVGIVYR